MEMSLQQMVDNQEKINSAIIDNLESLNERLIELESKKSKKFINQTKEGLD